MASDKEIVTFVLDGKEFEADRSALTSYAVTKRVANAENDPLGYFRAMESIFMGRDEEYAEALGGGAEKVAELYSAAAKAAGAKNS